MRYEPYKYQRAAYRWIIDHPRCGLFLDMGLGKTVITLTAIRDLIDSCEVTRALVVAPKKVAESTWTAESDKWDHLRSLRIAKAMGSERQRIQALESDADVYVIGRDSFVWLCGWHKGALPYDCIVIDELTSFKSPGSQRFKAMRVAAACCGRVIGLTGTPAPNGYADLWAQMYCIDRGERLGRSVTKFRDAYFDQHRWNNIVVRMTPKKGAVDAIMGKISDICLSMQASDYLELPDMIVHDERILLTDKTRKAYEEFEREKVLEFAEAHDGEQAAVIANSAAALMNKLSQMANGAVYDGERNVHTVHDEKLDRLCEIVEAANGSSVLVFYQYQHDAARIMERLKRMSVRKYEGDADLRDWNAGKIEVLLAHPASTAYGLNMQAGGHYIAWYGTGWNLEQYMQANARLHRQGQRCPVHVYRLICAGTVDERAAMALEGKRSGQQALLDGLDYLMRKHGKGQQA